MERDHQTQDFENQAQPFEKRVPGFENLLKI